MAYSLNYQTFLGTEIYFEDGFFFPLVKSLK